MKILKPARSSIFPMTSFLISRNFHNILYIKHYTLVVVVVVVVVVVAAVVVVILSLFSVITV